MAINDFLQFVDNLVFAQTNEHLNDVQKNIVEGLLNGDSYKKIADNSSYDEGYIGDLSRKLYKILSNHLGEEINKSNFCWTIERIANNKFVNLGNNQISYCGNKTSKFPINKQNNYSDIQKVFHDLRLAPHCNFDIERVKELEQLYIQIFKENKSLISVLGLSGIGKTTLVKKFIDLHLEEFDILIWHSFKYPQTFDLFIDGFLDFCQLNFLIDNKDNKIAKIAEVFKEKRCLIIFDDLENIFTKNQLCGQYQKEYQDYEKFFKTMTEIEHQSHIILISQEKSSTMDSFNQHSSQCVELSGLYSLEIIKNLAINNHNEWLNLIKMYEGNINYVRDIGILIKNIFNGDVKEFLAEDNLVITPNIKLTLDNIFNRLCDVEKKIINEFVKYEKPLTRQELKTNLDLPSMDFINGLNSLKNRYLVTKIGEDKNLFQLSTIFQEYIISFCS